MIYVVLIIAIVVIAFAFSSSSKKNDKLKTEKKSQRGGYHEIKTSEQLNKISSETLVDQEKDDVYSLTFEVQDTNKCSSEDLAIAWSLNEAEPLKLEWERDNPDNQYAISIKTIDGHFIGYVPVRYSFKLHKIVNENTICNVVEVKEGKSKKVPIIVAEIMF